VASLSTGPAIDRDFNRTGNPTQQMRLKEGSESVNLPSGLKRVVGFSRMRRAPWLVIVGLPAESGSLNVAKAAE
jgi:hypothetical protein